MFAPDPRKAADELLRACRPGGKIGMANWTPDGFWGQTFALQWRYLPPPVALRPPSEWGTEARLRELFGDTIASIRIARRSALFRYKSSKHWIEVFSTYFGPIIRALETLAGERRQAYLKELEDILNRFNHSGDDTLMVSADYLEAVMVVK
jgi:SAM-dependent methyltransferase